MTGVAASVPQSQLAGAQSGGLLWGSLGVIMFSMSLPATRAAVSGFSPVFVTSARAAIAGALALLVMTTVRGRWPARRHWPGLLVVAIGVVVGYPLLTTIALTQVEAVHGVVVTALLPAATAIAGVLLARERPSAAFWLSTGAGLVSVLVFAMMQGSGHLAEADWLLLLAVVACAAGYAAGGVLSREMGGPWVIGWALILCLPVSLPLSVWHWDPSAGRANLPAWIGLLYVALISQYLGFVAWYRGLALGGIARVGQLKLAQPVLSLLLAVVLLGETATPSTVIAAAAVLACLVVIQRSR